MATKDLTNSRFGRWTVLEKLPGPGAAKWLCRCSCGTERAVAAKNLLAGVSTSCGCYTKERVRETRLIDHKGLRYGRLLVIEQASAAKNGAPRWKCVCDCGKECIVPAASLRSGKRTSCGCDSQRGKNTAKNVAGEKFSMLTALYPTQERGHNGSVMWHCRCECGNEVDVPLDRLKFGGVISCGCMREKHNAQIADRLIHVAGTSIDAIRSERVRTDNKTGVKGVFVKRGRYCASITFQQKTYYLGSFRTLEAAAMVRREAEEVLHKGALEQYEKWKRRADRDPEWAEMNPIEIHVAHSDGGNFSVELLPAEI